MLLKTNEKTETNNFTKTKRKKLLNQRKTYAEKSAEPVAARRALVSKQQLHTAPLCPSNVPIQSPVSPFLSMGLESKPHKLTPTRIKLYPTNKFNQNQEHKHILLQVSKQS